MHHHKEGASYHEGVGMTRDEIMKMANESGLVSDYKQYDDWIDAGPGGQELIAFAKLVAQAEREACLEVTDSRCQCGWGIMARNKND